MQMYFRSGRNWAVAETVIHLNYNSKDVKHLTPIHDLVLKKIEVWIYDTFSYIKSEDIRKIPIKWLFAEGHRATSLV